VQDSRAALSNEQRVNFLIRSKGSYKQAYIVVT